MAWTQRLRALVGSGSALSVAKVAGGAASAQLMALIALPLLSRLYSPKAFGDLAVILAMSLLASTVVTLRLEFAVANAVREDDATYLARLGLLSAIVLTAAMVPISFIPGVSHLSVAFSGHYIAWLGAATLLTAAFTILSQLYVWRGEFGTLGLRSFWQGLVTSVGGVALGLAGAVASGLLLSQALGRVAAIGLMARSIRTVSNTDLVSKRPRWRTLWQYPVLFMPSGLLNNLGSQLPLLLTAFWFGSEAAGLLGVAQRVLILPAALVGLAISQVFLGRLTDIRRMGQRDQRRLVMRALALLSPIGLVITVGALALSPTAAWLLGGQWAGVEGFIKASCVMFGLSFVAAPLQQVLVANARGGLNLILDASRVVLVSLAALFGHSQGWGAEGVVLAMSFGQAVNYALTILLAWLSARRWDLERGSRCALRKVPAHG